jgi:hypothetical protein
MTARLPQFDRNYNNFLIFTILIINNSNNKLSEMMKGVAAPIARVENSGKNLFNAD